MKKLKLDQQKFAGAEVLSRAQLRKVMGGEGSGNSPKVAACCGKAVNDDCNFTLACGFESKGKCQSYFTGPLHCSDLT